MSLGDRVAATPARPLVGVFWHQGAARRDLMSCADPAVTDGHYHRRDGPGVWYASDQEQAAWAELFRHFTGEGIDPFEVRRRTGRVQVHLDVLDLTDEQVRTHLGVDVADLLGDDYGLSQEIAVGSQTCCV